jgi:hypothetical protein
MRLTDLARADWTVDQIAQYAGHRDLSTTSLQRYGGCSRPS